MALPKPQKNRLLSNLLPRNEAGRQGEGIFRAGKQG